MLMPYPEQHGLAVTNNRGTFNFHQKKKAMIISSKNLNRLFTILLLFSSYFFVRNIVRPELYYHVQQPSFSNGWAFFAEYTAYPGGILEYVSNFLLQLFFINWAGSIVIICLGLAISLLCFLIFKSFFQSCNFLLCLLPLILLTGVVCNYNYPFNITVNVLAVYFLALTYVYLVKKNVRNVFSLLISIPAIYYLAGSGCLIIYLASVLILNFFIIKNYKHIALLSVFTLLYSLTIEYIAYKFVYSIAPGKAFFSLLPDGIPVFLSYKTNLLFYWFCFSLPVFGLILLVFKRIENFVFARLNPGSLFLQSVIFILILGFSTYVMMKSFNKQEKNVILTDYYSYTEKWPKVIEIAKTDIEYNIFINFNFNRAIDNAGSYLESYFDYPQLIGIDALYPDKLNSPQLTMISSDYYFDLGHIRESEHWANEALIDFPYSLRILKRLVVTNIILGNYSGAEKYLSVLRGNFLAKDFTKKYLPYINDTTLISKDSLIMYKRACIPDSLHFPDYVVNRFDDLITKNKLNKRAFEHKQLYFLLEHQLGFFADNLEISLQFYKQPPKLYQEAILMYNYSVAENQNLISHKVSPEVANSFRIVIQTMNNNKDKEIAKSLLGEFSNTYMYYVLYNSPLVTNFQLTRDSSIGY
jgi:tetratricopeptide (TPR) repeat protein